ncbi:MAG: Ubiquinone biosynthesis O-methyltransferase [candidate division BRC1 bacterium ADurb.BinA364]|nr:MAG: Ubiquinone biosynthesis O-methyltransferase [candidate division BRC1 bacterium ADurb.BinA364]
MYSLHESPREYDGYFDKAALDERDLHYWGEAHRAMYAAFVRLFLRPLKRKSAEAAQGHGRQSLLDAGCGLGFFLHFLATEAPEWQARGVETSPRAVRFARQRLGLDCVWRGGLESAPFAPGTFDCLTLWDVLEHIGDPHPFLRRAAELLAPGGLLFLHTPNAEVQLAKARLKRAIFGLRPGGHYLEARDHLNLYSPARLSALLERHGFEAIRFVHLPPIQSVSGARSRTLAALKTACALAAAGLHRASFGRLNLDNLFVAARRAPREAGQC